MAPSSEDLSSGGIQEESHKVGLIVGGVAAVALLLFVFQNTEKTTVDWLFWNIKMPLFLLIIITVALTLVVTVIAAWVLNRRSKK